MKKWDIYVDTARRGAYVLEGTVIAESLWLAREQGEQELNLCESEHVVAVEAKPLAWESPETELLGRAKTMPEKELDALYGMKEILLKRFEASGASPEEEAVISHFHLSRNCLYAGSKGGLEEIPLDSRLAEKMRFRFRNEERVRESVSYVPVLALGEERIGKIDKSRDPATLEILEECASLEDTCALLTRECEKAWREAYKNGYADALGSL